MGPSTASIMARCSRFSCVWNSASPARACSHSECAHGRGSSTCTAQAWQPLGVGLLRRCIVLPCALPWPRAVHAVAGTASQLFCQSTCGIVCAYPPTSLAIKAVSIMTRPLLDLQAQQLQPTNYGLEYVPAPELHHSPLLMPNSAPDPETQSLLHTAGQLHQDAADAPDVAGEGPAQAQDDLGGPVVPRGHHAAVVVGVKGGAAKVYHLYLPALGPPPAYPAPVPRTIRQ